MQLANISPLRVLELSAVATAQSHGPMDIGTPLTTSLESKADNIRYDRTHGCGTQCLFRCIGVFVALSNCFVALGCGLLRAWPLLFQNAEFAAAASEFRFFARNVVVDVIATSALMSLCVLVVPHLLASCRMMMIKS